MPFRKPASTAKPPVSVARFSAIELEQYIKTLKALFSSDRWPATEVTEPDGTVRFVLNEAKG